jgi:putative oxidoreductase
LNSARHAASTSGSAINCLSAVSTKIPILLGHDFWIFHVPKLPRYGFWSMLHEGRADFCLLVGSLYLSIEGGGKWSFDALLSHDHSRLSD